MENVKNVAYGTHVTMIDKIVQEPVKLRVAAYARVSSDSEDQINSYIAQVDFYTKYITTHEGWELVDIYADEGLTGMETKHRDEFNRMIKDCRDGKIDRILVKSVSRFARNTQEYILYMRELLRLGVTIYFEKEHLDTGKMTSEQNAAIYGAFAQMETTGHSQNMRVSNRIRMEKGLFTISHPPYGYRLQGTELVVVPEEAEVVRKIYNAYLSGKGKQEIARSLSERGIRGEKGPWALSSIDYILKNITYTGSQIWHKRFSEDVIPLKEVRNIGQKPKYFAKDCCPAIISTESFDLVQDLLRRRNEAQRVESKSSSKYHGHIQCSECGCACRTKTINGRLYLICHNRNLSKDRCTVPPISEETITLALQSFLLRLGHDNISLLRSALENLYEIQGIELRSDKKITDIDLQLAKLTERNHVLSMLKAKGYMDPALYLSEQNEVNGKAWELRKLRRKITDRAKDDLLLRQTETMIDYLETNPDLPENSDSEIFSQLVDKILLAPDGKIIIRTINGMEFTETTKGVCK